MKSIFILFLLAVVCNSQQSPTNVKLISPISMDFDSIGSLYIADSNLSQIFQISPSYGMIAIFAGTGSKTFSGDQGNAIQAGFDVRGISILKSQGALYLCNHQIIEFE